MTKVLRHMKDGEVIKPDPVKDGLALWYDFAGSRNSDSTRSTAKDWSGNNNNGPLRNFNFSDSSGYNKNRLLFDGIDDQLQIPELNLDEAGMSVVVDGKVYSYEDDKVLTVGEDGGVAGIGRNLIIGSDRTFNSIGQILSVSQDANAEELINQLNQYEYITVSVDVEIEGADTNRHRENRVGYEIGIVYEDGSNAIFSSFLRPSEGQNFKGRISEIRIRQQKIIRIRHSLLINQTGGTVVISARPKLEGGSEATPWLFAPEDNKTTILNPSSMQSLLLYNRALTEEDLIQTQKALDGRG